MISSGKALGWTTGTLIWMLGAPGKRTLMGAAIFHGPPPPTKIYLVRCLPPMPMPPLWKYETPPPPPRGCHKDAHPFFFNYGMRSLMVEKHQILRYLSW